LSYSGSRVEIRQCVLPPARRFRPAPLSGCYGPLRQRGRGELARLAALPPSAWKSARIERAGRYRNPRLHEDMTTLKGINAKVRQIAIRGIGRDEPTLLITNDVATPAKELFACYAERMTIENELDASISGFHLDALPSGVPLNGDLDTTLTV